MNEEVKDLFGTLSEDDSYDDFPTEDEFFDMFLSSLSNLYGGY